MEQKEVVCSFCGGQGRDPFGIMSWLSTCCVCGGRGVVLVTIPFWPCRHCRGTGAVKTLTCTVCGGKGYLPAPTGLTAGCPECWGTGDDPSAPAMACLTCQGRGWVRVGPGPGDGRGGRSRGVGRLSRAGDENLQAPDKTISVKE